MDHPFLRWMDRLYLFTIWAAGTAIFFMSLIIPWGVFSRYVMGTGSQWPEPIAILLLIRPCEVLSRVANVTILEVANNALRVLLQHRHVIIGSLA